MQPMGWAGRPAIPFYRQLNELLAEAGFDRWLEKRCRQYYATQEKRGQPSIPPGVDFRMLLVGYFEGIDSQRGMSEEPKRSPEKCFSWPAAACIIAVIVAYQMAHYATAQYAEFAPGAWGFDKHVIDGEPAPRWVESLFWPATQIDEALDVRQPPF